MRSVQCVAWLSSPSPAHSWDWMYAGMIGSGTRSITRSSCLQAGHRAYLNQDLASCKRMPARGSVSSCWQCLQRKMRWFIRLPSHRDDEVDTCRVHWQDGATCPQAADLDVDSSEVSRFLPLQGLDGCPLGQPGNASSKACLLDCTHLVDPHALSGDEQGERSGFGMWRCSCRGDGGPDRSAQGVPCPQGRHRLLQKRTRHQSHHCPIVVGFSMTGDRDTHSPGKRHCRPGDRE